MSYPETLGDATATDRLPGRWLVAGSAALLALGSFAAWQVWQGRQGDLPPTTVAAAPEISTVTALARLEPQGETIRLAAPTSLQENRIAELLVAEGDRVEAGQPIAVLDGRARLQAALQQAEGHVAVAQAELAQVLAGAKVGELQAQEAEIGRLQAQLAGNLATQQAAIARLEAEVENARLEAERYDFLHGRGAISASQRDAKDLAYGTAERQLQEARAELGRIRQTTQQQVEQARATLDRIAEVRPTDVAAARAELEAATAAAAEARVNLEEITVRSPQAGQILEIHTRPGETITEDGIVTLGQTQQMLAVADIYQSDIAKIQLGQSAEIESPTLAEPLRGTVERIGLQVGRQQVVNEDPAANIDAKVVEVHIRLDPESSQKVAGLTNLQVTATVRIQ